MRGKCPTCSAADLVPEKITVLKRTERGDFTIMVPGFKCPDDGEEYLTPESQDAVDAWSASIDEQERQRTG